MSCEKLQITLLADEWKSSKGGLSTFNRELAIELAKQPNLAVTFFVPTCTEEDKKAAGRHNIDVVEARALPGFSAAEWLCFPPKDLHIDTIIGHGVTLGKQAQVIRESHHCTWMQVVHTAPEKLAMFKTYPSAISRGDEKQWTEVNLCTIADLVVTVGPKLYDFYSRYLSRSEKKVINLTPGIFTELSDLKQSTQGSKEFWILVFGRGDSEDFELKGFDIAARAVAELNDGSYHLTFVGAPSGNEKQVADKLLEQGLSRSQLTVKGFIENRKDLATLLSTANLAVIPSRTEGFGLTALEALSAGLPFLVCQNSGFGEALQEVHLGSSWIVDSDDPKKWAEAIKGVRKKGREIALKECQELRTLYAAKYSWEKQCNDLVETMLTNFTEHNKNLHPVNHDQRRDLLRSASWPSGGDAYGEKQESGKDGRFLINRSVSQERSRKNSKERKGSTGKGFINSVFKAMRRKKSSGPSSTEKNSVAFERTFKSSLEPSVATSGTEASSYSKAAQQSCDRENVSPLDVTEARRLSLTVSLSSRESIPSPISPGYEFVLAEDPYVSSEKTISFIHCFDLEGKAFKEEVFKLYHRFERWGYKCHLDKLETIEVAENKFRYALNSVHNSDFLFICVSPELKRIFDSSCREISKSLEDDEQCILRFTSDQIIGKLAADASNTKGKFMPIILGGSSTNDVPCFMNSCMRYRWPKDEETIRGVIEGKPEIVLASVRNLRTDQPSLVVKPAKLN